MDRRQFTAALLAAALGVVGCAAETPPPTVSSVSQTVFVMRHLEKGQGEDPPLTEIGAAHANALAGLLADRKIRAIFTSDTRRAKETAAPLAARLHIGSDTYDPRNPDALAAQVRAVPGNVLVVGHSNTVPALLQMFGGPPIPPLGETDFGTVWAVDRATGTAASFTIPELTAR